MINAVEVMYDEKQLVDEEQLAIEKSYNWERIRDSLQQLLFEVYDERKDTARYFGDDATHRYTKLELMLHRAQSYVEGQIEELHPGTYKHRREVFREERGALQYALQEGINAVALEGLPRAEWKDAIEYISEHGLASRSYEVTRGAVIDYCIDKNAREYGIRLSHEEAERIWG